MELKVMTGVSKNMIDININNTCDLIKRNKSHVSPAYPIEMSTKVVQRYIIGYRAYA